MIRKVLMCWYVETVIARCMQISTLILNKMCNRWQCLAVT